MTLSGALAPHPSAGAQTGRRKHRRHLGGHLGDCMVTGCRKAGPAREGHSGLPAAPQPCFPPSDLYKTQSSSWLTCSPAPPILLSVSPTPAHGQGRIFSRGVAMETSGKSNSEGFSQHGESLNFFPSTGLSYVQNSPWVKAQICFLKMNKFQRQT